MLPASSPATHSDASGQASASIWLKRPTWDGVQVVTPPVGSVELQVSPIPSIATHIAVEGHETLTAEAGLFSATARLSGATVQAPAPPVGSVELTRSRSVSTATHRVTAGQETLLSE